MASFIRTWHCSNPDNFGRLGEKPSHPELLDYLASKFREDGWSIKTMIKFIVTSETFVIVSTFLQSKRDRSAEPPSFPF